MKLLIPALAVLFITAISSYSCKKEKCQSCWFDQWYIDSVSMDTVELASIIEDQCGTQEELDDYKKNKEQQAEVAEVNLANIYPEASQVSVTAVCEPK